MAILLMAVKAIPNHYSKLNKSKFKLLPNYFSSFCHL